MVQNTLLHATSLKGERTLNEDVIMEAVNLKKYFPIKMGLFKRLLSRETMNVHAVDDVTFRIKAQEILGLVGESGSGKTTTGRLLLRLIEPSAGKIYFKGEDITQLSDKEMWKIRRKLQIIFQDPYESLNPRMKIMDIISEPLKIQKVASESEVLRKVTDVMQELEIVPPEEFLYRFPHELSGGQRQRVSIARAFVLEPEFVVADEPVSMLDASIRSEVIRETLSLVKRCNCAFLYITHDLALTRYICDRIAVMYAGKIVEQGPTDEIIQRPLHPYTEALLGAVPVPDPTARRTQITIKGEMPSAMSLPPGCRFHIRCPYSKEKCRKEEPELIVSRRGRYVACHFPLDKY